MFSQSLTIADADTLYQALEPEKKDLVAKRAKVDITKDGSAVTITIEAKDFPSYRAMQSAVMRLLVTYYKMKSLEA